MLLKKCAKLDCGPKGECIIKKSKALCKCENGELRKKCTNKKRLMQKPLKDNSTKKDRKQKSRLNKNKNATLLAN